MLFALSIIFFQCTEKINEIPESFDYGKSENGVYSNDFFDLKFEYDTSWVLQSKEEMNELAELGTEVLADGDEEMKQKFDAATINSAYLFTAFQYEVGSTLDFNPSVIVMAENTKFAFGIRNGKDYLEACKKQLNQTGIDCEFNDVYGEQKVGSAVFPVLNTKMNYGGISVSQDYMTTVTKGFSLTFILSYTTEEQKELVYSIFESAEF